MNESEKLESVDITDLYIPTDGKNDKSLGVFLNSCYKNYIKNSEFNNKILEKKRVDQKKETPTELGKENKNLEKNIYCMKCKEKTENTGGVTYYLFSNGALNAACVCGKCGGPKRSMIKRDKLPEKILLKLNSITKGKNEKL